MLSQEQILLTLRNIKPQLEKNYGVKTLALFGSYSRNEALPGSDIDVMVEFDKSPGIRFIDLADELEQLLHHKVDLVSRKAVKSKYYLHIESQLIYV